MKMKKYFYSLLCVAALFASCKKKDGPIPSDVNLARVPQPQVVKAGGSLAIDMINLDDFAGTFTVGLYVPTDVKPSKFDVVIRKNGNNAGTQVFQANVTTFPSTFNITAAQIAALFGAPITLNDNYDVSVDIYTQSGAKFEAFPNALVSPGVYAVGYGSGIAGQPGASTSTRYSAICAWDPALYPTGDYEVLVDEWAEDYAPGDVVTLTQVSPTQLSFSFLPDSDSQPIIINVNPATNVTSVTKQVYGNYSWNPYGLMSVNSVASNDNVAAPCDLTIGVLLAHTVSIGSYGNYLIKFKKL